METHENSGSRSSEEIRQDIERTRAEMHSTVDQLEARLTPGQVLDEIWGRLRGGSGAGEVVKEHPVPLALMGLGVAWLAVERATRGGDQGSHGYVGSTDRAEGRVGPYRGDEVDHIKFNDRVTGVATTGDMSDGTGHGLKARAGELAGGAKDRLSGAVDGVKDHASHLAESAHQRMDGLREQSGELRGRAGETARRATGGIDRVIHDQPLIAGAVTFGLGLAAGLAMPATRFEDERLGEKADALKETAKERVSEVADSVKQVASETAGAVKEVARDAMDDPQLKEALVAKVRDVAEQTKTAVADIAEERGVDTTRLKASGSRGVSPDTGGSGMSV